jgi:hypothetical protein
MDDFFKTRRGTKFFDMDLPKLASQLERIAEALEKKNIIEEKRLVLEHKKFIKENKNNNDLEIQIKEDGTI